MSGTEKLFDVFGFRYALDNITFCKYLTFIIILSQIHKPVMDISRPLQQFYLHRKENRMSIEINRGYSGVFA